MNNSSTMKLNIKKNYHHDKSVAKATSRVTKTETVKRVALAVAAGDGKSPTVSLKKDPNCEVFEKT